MKNKDNFSAWFERESGYALHKGHFPARKAVSGCCGGEPEKTGLHAVLHQKEVPEEELYRCPACKSWFFRERGGYRPAGNLLRYRIVEGEEKDACH